MEDKSYKRRKFLKNSLLVGGAAVTGIGFSACESKSEVKNIHISSSKTYKWKAVTTWPSNFPVLGEAINNLAKDIQILSQNKIKIKVYGAGELVPALGVFDAVSSGLNVQLGHSASYYWSGKINAAPFFASIPFGMNAQQMNAWLYYGGGLELWQKLYEPFNLIPFPSGNTGVQMGGWFNKEIRSIEDYEGLKMRIPGLGGKVVTKIGGSAINVSGGEIYTNLERGVIDATEWIGPYHDYNMGFNKIAKFYYYPGWHEPGSVLELIVNKKVYDELPQELQVMISSLATKYNTLVLAEFEARNNDFLNRILSESDIQLKQFPDELLERLKAYTDEVIQELIGEDQQSKEIYEHFTNFKAKIKRWGSISERALSKYL